MARNDTNCSTLEETALDPYLRIKAEIQQEFEQLEHLHAAWFSGNVSVRNELRSALQGLEDQLEALEAAVSSMVASPERFGLTKAMAFQRQVEVENLRFQLSDVSRISQQALGTSSSSQHFSSIELGDTRRWPSDQASKKGYSHGGNPHTSSSSSSSKRPPVGHTGPNGLPTHHRYSPGRSTEDDDDVGTCSTHLQQQLKDQDQTLEEISLHVEQIKHTGQVIHSELEEQDALLGGLHDDADTTHTKLRGVQARVQDIIRKTRQDKQLLLIVVLSVVLFVLTLMAFA